ncbi:MAG: DNA-processing protein DprA [Desulfarculus sp.]|nr:DNA-processing protein DprA [Pseudomonadota bacterium]MBV1716304.1 DNA-processing protein DprA [Desulfarculus sp.]MBU4574206.1 DNA-processing protein DprA [Pseudomonadota bacterium]MBU4599350.1 DNA-processing protein DprA [Pseudomonadota bacterium]MBV1739373.1 DNA-processing protein DprA [Desulfarculus sp.]
MEGQTRAQGSGELLDWLGLKLIPGVGSVTFARLLAAFGSPGAVLGAPLEALQAIPRLRPQVARAVHRRAWEVDPGEQLARLEKLGGHLLTLDDPAYPPFLKGIHAPPPLLFVLGDLSPCQEGGIAVVGSRAMSPYGRRLAGELGRDVARRGVSLVSGLARGVDAAAHTGCLEAGGHTVGVLGCGLDVAYPREHRELIARMAAQGAVVSEFPLGTQPAPAHFPVRNRVISGLSRAVVVVEAGLKSGSLITARHALEQGREVFAVPGPVGSATSAGSNQLIKEGARLLTSSRDLFEPGALPPSPGPGAPRPEEPGELSPAEAELLKLVGPEPQHIDQIGRASGLAPGDLATLLLNLVLAERVVELPGKHYVLNL